MAEVKYTYYLEDSPTVEKMNELGSRGWKAVFITLQNRMVFVQEEAVKDEEIPPPKAE